MYFKFEKFNELKQLTGIAKLYGMMKLFNISVTKQHRNNGNLIQNPLEKEAGIALFILKKKLNQAICKSIKIGLIPNE